ncbi:MAG TPA: hypothetical protein VLA00_14800 [Xanthobacteraceae bacterium]|nr:hypothetical protein [Xanthobacteraceae bacterium]
MVGCRTAEQLEQAENRHMQSVVGLTMADFSAQTGVTPTDAYDVAGGRTFVVLGRSVTLVTPSSYGAPTVANTQTCLLLVATKQIGTGGTAESWQIVGVSYSGPCIGMY